MDTAGSVMGRIPRDRPLRGLVKADFFAYADEDPDNKDRMWTFAMEMLSRNTDFNALAIRVKLSAQELDSAKNRLHHLETQEVAAGQASARALAVDAQKRFLVRCKEHAEANQRALEQKQASGLILSTEDIAAFWTKRYTPEWNDITAQWQAGTLFKAQSYGWMSFLMAPLADIRADSSRYHHVCGIAELIGGTGPLFQSIKAIGQIRITPSWKARGVFVNRENGAVATLSDEQRREYQKWQRRYNLATFNFRWPDDDGVANDPRAFNPQQEETQDSGFLQ